MKALPDDADAALAPLRARLVDTAEATATQLASSARKQADAVLAEATLESDRIRSAAVADGEAAAASAAALVSARARRKAQEAILERRNTIRLELRQQVTHAAAALTADTRYAMLLSQLTKRAHDLLGPDATVTESPHGGVVAVSGSRRADLSLPSLAERTLDSMNEEIAPLWTR